MPFGSPGGHDDRIDFLLFRQMQDFLRRISNRNVFDIQRTALQEVGADLIEAFSGGFFQRRTPTTRIAG